MTTIAYRFHHECGEMAADTGISSDDVRVGHSRKITKNADGDLCGIAGDLSFAQSFRDWFEGGERGEPEKPVDEHPYGCAMIIRVGAPRTIILFDTSGWCEYESPIAAIGSGDKLALAAMSYGAPPRAAVRVAMQHDVYTFGRIQSLTLGKDTDQ